MLTMHLVHTSLMHPLSLHTVEGTKLSPRVSSLQRAGHHGVKAPNSCSAELGTET